MIITIQQIVWRLEHNAKKIWELEGVKSKMLNENVNACKNTQRMKENWPMRQ